MALQFLCGRHLSPLLLSRTKCVGHSRDVFYSTVGGGGFEKLSVSVKASKFDEACEIVDHRTESKVFSGKVMITAEHASNELPKPYQWSTQDQNTVADAHWAYDPGTAECARELAQELGAVAVLGRWSRLLVDLNRPLASDTLMRTTADMGQPIQLNADLPQADRDWRLQRYYLPFHLELGRAARVVDPLLLLSIHSFSPVYDGEVRDFEIGVLASTEETLARQLVYALQRCGYDTRLNEPWSGKEGFMYSADSVKVSGPPGRRQAVMLEFRNDLLSNRVWRAGVVSALAESLSVDTVVATDGGAGSSVERVVTRVVLPPTTTTAHASSI